MSKAVAQNERVSQWSKFSDSPDNEQSTVLNACGALTDSIYEGLNVEHEIRAVATQKLGDTVLLWTDNKLAGFAVSLRSGNRSRQ